MPAVSVFTLTFTGDATAIQTTKDNITANVPSELSFNGTATLTLTTDVDDSNDRSFTRTMSFLKDNKASGCDMMSVRTSGYVLFTD